MPKTCEYLIVGQGVAGTSLAYQLLKADKDILLIDNGHKYSSTKIAAGLINPVTGRKYVKSWMIDKLLPFAHSFYRSLEDFLEARFLHEIKIVRNIPNIEAHNNWMARVQDPAYGAYLSTIDTNPFHGKHIYSECGFGYIENALRIDLSELLACFQRKLKEREMLLTAAFDFNLFDPNKNSYGDIQYEKIIFCEGYKCLENPYFDFIAFEPVKGEAVILRIPELDMKDVLRHTRFLIPLGNDLYWTGGGYERTILDEAPSQAFLKNLDLDLQSFLNLPYEIVSHKAAVRPAIRGRKPVIGEHPKYSNMYVCNGMGTKGASLAPYFSKMLFDYIESGLEILEEVDVSRFS